MREAGLTGDQSNSKKVAAPGAVLTEGAPSGTMPLCVFYVCDGLLPKESWLNCPQSFDLTLVLMCHASVAYTHD